jgi:hypothetical protein
MNYEDEWAEVKRFSPAKLALLGKFFPANGMNHSLSNPATVS